MTQVSEPLGPPYRPTPEPRLAPEQGPSSAGTSRLTAPTTTPLGGQIIPSGEATPTERQPKNRRQPEHDLFMLTTHSKFRPIKYHEMELSNTDVKIFQTYECYAAHPATMFFRRVQGFLQNDRG